MNSKITRHLLAFIFLLLPLASHAETPYVEIDSVPSGVAVIVNGFKLETAAPCYIRLPPGSHEITLEKESYKTETEKIFLKSGEFKLIHKTLQKLSAVEIETQPTGATVIFKKLNEEDRAYRKITPFSMQNIEQGDYELLIEKRLHNPARQKIKVGNNPFRAIYFLSKKDIERAEVLNKEKPAPVITTAAPSLNAALKGDTDRSAVIFKWNSLKSPLSERPIERQAASHALPEDKAKVEESDPKPDNSRATEAIVTDEEGEIGLKVMVEKLTLGMDETFEVRVVFYRTTPGSLPSLSEPGHDGFTISELLSKTNYMWINGKFNPVKTTIYRFSPTKEGTFDAGSIHFAYNAKKYVSKPFKVSIKH